jgi:hypothetical protein
MIVKPRIIWPWLLPVLSGCIALPRAGPGRGVVGGDGVSVAQRESLSDRPVSRSDVIQQLGPPTIEFTDLRVSAYAWVEHQRDWTLYVPHGYLPIISTLPFENLERSILYFHWDADERVTAIGVRGQQQQDSLRAQALAWLGSENIVADAASAVAAEIPRTAPAAATATGRLVVHTAEAPPHFEGWLRNVYRCQLLAVLVDDRLEAELQPRARWDIALTAGPHQLAIDPWPSYRYSPSERRSNAFN